ncbi:hypothetical protein GCG54_00009302 [Colletotrichum gloeosporioides]|uniref:Azaphilone pigments biosynthesis cluster protein L N-terminal domain-containing protein n=1 Tax=Colletotrichum gloeosporioides TaxID=474922 RepID=A0A8H4FCU7_COLGL|nr:uncharacterized protein GCG54_00009302 [Colletotrichum gloeosporioides]KAF3797331.1 hypothetical protein GCG54_00009302 [Colletotrichum gloeosporioides]
MAEIIGTVSGAFGLTTTVLHSIRVISSDIDGIKRASQDILSLKRELRSVECLIQSLQISLEAEAETDDSQERVIVTALLACDSSCGNFRREFSGLLSSTDGGLNLVDKIKFGLWTKKRMEPFLADLSSCKSTVSLVLSGANYFAAREQFKQLQSVVAKEATEPRHQDERIVEPEDDFRRAEQWSQGYQEQLSLLLSKVNLNRTKFKMGRVDMVDSHGAVGLNNVDGTEGDLDIQFGDVKAEGSRAVIGYNKNINLNAVFQ